ncbi:MAG: dihydroneopterin aldolase [Bacteroidaceae bacterium]|nr:dihydroneopterin aldolase [Bacteroidaceae bacterium]
MKIFLNNIQLRAQHGVMPQEQTVGAQFLVSVEAETNANEAVDSDELRDTVSYADMADIVKAEMAIPARLLEHAAGRIARHLLNRFPTLTGVTVRLTKLAPPITGLQCDGAGVEIKLENNI